MGFLRSRLARNIGLVVGLGAGMLGFASRDASAAEPTITAEQVIVPVVGRGSGYNGSLWRSELFLVNSSFNQDGHGRIVFYNTDPGNDDTNPSTAVTVPARGNLVIVDPAGQAGLDGNWAVKYIPDAGTPQLDVKARTWNEQDVAASNPALTDLSQYVDGVKQSQLLASGDIATFVLPDSEQQPNGQPRFRFNIHAYGEASVAGEAPAMTVELFDYHGNYVNTRWLTLPDHGRAQWTNFVPTVFDGSQQGPYDVLRFTVTKGKVLMIGTPVQNNTDVTGLDDGGVQQPTIDRLVQSIEFMVAPGTVEANDPYVMSATVTSRPGTVVEGISIDSYTTLGTTNQTSVTTTQTTSVPGTYNHELSFTIKNEHGAEYPGHVIKTHTVEAEPADYSPADSYSRTQTHIEDLVALIGGNINTVFINNNTHYTSSEVRSILQTYTNGTTGASDPELDRVIIKEGTNSVDFRRTDGGTAVWAGFTETQMRQLRDLYE